MGKAPWKIDLFWEFLWPYLFLTSSSLSPRAHRTTILSKRNSKQPSILAQILLRKQPLILASARTCFQPLTIPNESPIKQPLISTSTSSNNQPSILTSASSNTHHCNIPMKRYIKQLSIFFAHYTVHSLQVVPREILTLAHHHFLCLAPCLAHIFTSFISWVLVRDPQTCPQYHPSNGSQFFLESCLVRSYWPFLTRVPVSSPKHYPNLI